MKKTLTLLLALGSIALGGEVAVTIGGNVITASGVQIGGNNHTGSATVSGASFAADFATMNSIVTVDDKWYSNTNGSNVDGVNKVANAATVITDGPGGNTHPKWAAFSYTLSSAVLGQIVENTAITLSFDIYVSGGNNNNNQQGVAITLLSSGGNSETFTYNNTSKWDTPQAQPVLTLGADTVNVLRSSGGDQKLIFYFQDTQDINGSNEAWTMKNMVLTYTTGTSAYTWAATEPSAWTSAVWQTSPGGGLVEFAPNSDAVFDGTAAATQVDITSAVSAMSVTVGGKDYTFNLSDSAALTAQSLTVESALSITGSGTVQVNGALTQEGTLSLDSGVNMTAGSGIADASGKFALAGAGHLTLTSLNMGDAATQTLEVSDSATLTVSGTVSAASGKTLSIGGEGQIAFTTLKSTGGTINVTADLSVTGGAPGEGDGNNQKGIAITGGSGTVNINAGTTTVAGAVYSGGGSTGTLNVGTNGEEAKLVANRLEFGDTNSGGSVSRINIGANGTVVVTSANNDATVKTAGLAVAEWNQNTEISVDGKLYAQSTRIFAHDGLMTLKIQNNGIVAVKGITADKAQNNVVTLAGNGKLVLGDTGITSGQGTWNITLNGGEVGITADTTIARAINVAGAVTFNTDKYAWGDEGQTLTQGDEAGTITVSGNVTGNGTITKAGAGVLNLSGAANALTHTINLQAGTLTLSGAYDISGIAPSSQPTYVGDGGTAIAAGNGFKHTEGVVHVVNITDGGILSADTATFTYGTEQRTGLDENGDFTLSGSTDYSVLYVNNNGGVSYNAAWDVAQAQEPAVAITSVVMAADTTLTADKQGASFALSLAGTGTVNATAATTVTALTGTGKLVVDGSKTVAVQSISGYNGGYKVETGATLQIATTSLPNKLEVEGPGKLRLITDKQGTTDAQKNITLNEVVAQNLYLGAAGAETDGYNSRFMVNGSTKLDNVGHLYFDGAQLWLEGAGLNYSGDVTFLTTTYYENNAFGNAAMRVHHDGTFSGAVDVQDTAKLTWGAAGKTIEFSGALTGTGNIELRYFGTNSGTFRISGNAAGYGGAILSDAPITLALADNKALTINSGSDIKGAVTLGTGSSLTVTGDGDSSISGIISGNGGIVKDGDGTLTLKGANTYTGDTVVNGGTLDIQGSISDQSKVKVEESATLAGNTGDIKVGIVAGKTATFKDDWGFTPKDSGVTFSSDSGVVKVQNIGETEITYGIGEKNAQVTADVLYASADSNVTVENKLVVGEIVNYGDGTLTITNVATASLTEVSAESGDITLQNVGADPIELASLSLLDTTVAVYTDDTATTEGTVTITESLFAGSGTLLANLILDGTEGHVELNLLAAGSNNQIAALTLGSQFGIAEGTLVTLDDITICSLEDLAIGGSLDLIKAKTGTELTYLDPAYDGMWFGELFERTEGVHGDYRVYATGESFGLTKVSNTPEPTTGTLSLLALAALAARRRRR